MRGWNIDDTMTPNDKASFRLPNDSDKNTSLTRETFHISLKVWVITGSKASLGILLHKGFGFDKDRILIEKFLFGGSYPLLEQNLFNRRVKNVFKPFIMPQHFLCKLWGPSAHSMIEPFPSIPIFWWQLGMFIVSSTLYDSFDNEICASFDPA